MEGSYGYMQCPCHHSPLAHSLVRSYRSNLYMLKGQQNLNTLRKIKQEE
jgi:hypothetical protein